MNQRIAFPDNDILKKMRRIFDGTLMVYSFCYGRPFEELIVPEEDEEIRGLLDRALSEEERQLLVASFSDHPIENIIEGESRLPWVKIRGVSIRDRLERCVAVWVFVAFCEDLVPMSEKKLLPKGLRFSTEEKFDQAMPLVEQMNAMYFSIYNQGNELYDRVNELEGIQKDLEHERARNEVLTEILELLESDQKFSRIIDNILMIAGGYMSVSDALLLRRHQTIGKVDVMCDWRDGEEELAM